MFYSLSLLTTVTYGVSITVFPFYHVGLAAAHASSSLFRHFQCNHVAAVPGPRSSDGMDVSFCGTDRRWWVHVLSLSAAGFLSSGVTECTKLFLEWTTWRCLNRLRTCVTCNNKQRKKWGYYEWYTTYSALDTLAAMNRGTIGPTSIETQHVHAGWKQKTQLTCLDGLSCHITAPWMTF